ncbi:hypothetical protein SAMN05421823_102100 [Catalinimonas alkaloidigena]|uniref:Ig-like domain (Group 3) n=1 Tax=Catalinimonas alkaloidigena TaxID=1075417 RepID=A0A1G8ZV76_9BACT|nr:hypothetical protein [Catalinimonas alkaloidigena]SDK19016.1 hypothetical protein SAMN05421823_102100 [Catalinimonas alkaloidigena]
MTPRYCCPAFSSATSFLHYAGFLWSGFLLCTLGWAQTPAAPTARTYVDSAGRYFQQAALPVYLFVAATPDGRNATPLAQNNGGVEPMYLDGHGKHLIRHHDADHQEYVAFEIYADGYAPQTNASFSGAPTHRSGQRVYYGPGLSIALATTDEMSGVQATYFSMDGKGYQPYQTALATFAEGAHAYTYYATDRVGNQEAPHTANFTVDLSAPRTFHNITGFSADSIISSASKIYLTSEDNLAGIAATYYRLDSLPWKRYDGQGVPFTFLEDGPHRLTYYSEDQVANRETVKSVSFYYDKTAPIIASDVLGDRFVANGQVYFSGRTKLKLTAVDNKSGIKEVKYSIDNAPFTDYEEPFYLPNRPGLHEIRFYALDNAQNEGGSGRRDDPYARFKLNVSRVYVDLTGPKLTHQFRGKSISIGKTTFIGPTTDVVLTASDDESGLQYIAYAQDQQPGETRYEQPFQVTQHGPHQLALFGYDNVNNRNRSELDFTVDAHAPEISVSYSIGAVAENQYPALVSVFLAATDQDTGIDKVFYRLNGGSERTYAGPLSGFKPGQTYTLTIRAVDRVGNEATKEVSFATAE